MPEELCGKYQYYTEADLNNLRRAGYSNECHTLETSIADYTIHYLSHHAYLEAGIPNTWK